MIQSSTGFLFRFDPETGNATQVDLGGTALVNGDGLLLSGRTLFVVQNRDNQVAVVELNSAGTEGKVTEYLRTRASTCRPRWRPSATGSTCRTPASG